MKGVMSRCAICGRMGQVFGLPSYYYDVCRDVNACRLRVIENEVDVSRERSRLLLEAKVAGLSAKLTANTGGCT